MSAIGSLGHPSFFSFLAPVRSLDLLCFFQVVDHVHDVQPAVGASAFTEKTASDALSMEDVPTVQLKQTRRATSIRVLHTVKQLILTSIDSQQMRQLIYLSSGLSTLLLCTFTSSPFSSTYSSFLGLVE